MVLLFRVQRFKLLYINTCFDICQVLWVHICCTAGTKHKKAFPKNRKGLERKSYPPRFEAPLPEPELDEELEDELLELLE